jgi:hypothetical protein
MSHARIFLNRQDPATAAAITAAISTGTGFVYIGSTTVTPSDNTVAQAVGAARTAIAKANNLNSTRFRRGTEDERIDTEGALGEWLVANLLEGSGADLAVAAFVAHKAPKGEVDLVLAGSRIDVKTIGAAAGRNCNINYTQHAAKAPDAYLVVHVASARKVSETEYVPLMVDLFVVNASELTVAKEDGGLWELRTGFSKYYSCYMRQQLERLPAAEAA